MKWGPRNGVFLIGPLQALCGECKAKYEYPLAQGFGATVPFKEGVGAGNPASVRMRKLRCMFTTPTCEPFWGSSPLSQALGATLVVGGGIRRT